MPQTSSSEPGPTPAPGPAAPATVFDEVTNGYVPWSMSSRAPWAPSNTTRPPSSSTRHAIGGVSAMKGSRRCPWVAVLLGHRVEVELGRLGVRPQHQALGLHRRVDLLAQDVLVEQVLHADAEPGRLVGVAGSDAAPGGADLELAELRLALLVEQLVVRHDQVRVGRDAQAAEVDPAPAQLVDLGAQHHRIHHHAVADRAELARVEDPGRDQVELERLAFTDDRVAGVVAALEADHEVGLLGEQVDDLSLPLVAPLGADDHHSWHGESECRPVRR